MNFKQSNFPNLRDSAALKFFGSIFTICVLCVSGLMTSCGNRPKVDENLIKDFVIPEESQNFYHLESWQSNSEGLCMNFQINPNVPKRAIDFVFTQIISDGQLPKKIAEEIVESNQQLISELIQTDHSLKVNIYQTNPKDGADFTVPAVTLRRLLEGAKENEKVEKAAADSVNQSAFDKEKMESSGIKLNTRNVNYEKLKMVKR